MTYFRLLRCALLLTTGSIIIACGQKPSASETTQSSDPPLDDQLSNTELQLGRFASQHGALGHYYDASSGSFVIVFPADVRMPPRARIPTEFAGRVRVEQVEMTKEIYAAIESEAAQLHAQHRGSTYAVYLDLPAGKADLTSDLPRDVLTPLAEKYAGLVEIHAGSIRTDAAKQ